jgi:hypothetical protein
MRLGLRRISSDAACKCGCWGDRRLQSSREEKIAADLPIVAIDFPFKAVIREFKCGSCPRDPQEIETLARKILTDYDAYREMLSGAMKSNIISLDTLKKLYAQSRNPKWETKLL